MAKILICTPHPSFKGGVNNFYQCLNFSNETLFKVFPVTTRGRSGNILFLLVIITRFLKAVLRSETVLLNVSLDRKSILRDGLLLLITKILDRKCIVFFHGWEDSFAQNIQKQKLPLLAFQSIFSRADGLVVLGTIFKNKLRQLGVKWTRLIILPTVADDRYVPMKSSSKSNMLTDQVTILFMAGMLHQKGMKTALDTLKALQGSPENITYKMIMAGEGPDLEETKEYCASLSLRNVIFTGFVKDEEKHILLDQSDLLLLPTEYGEGMPCVIMEAMLYGLPIVTRPVGAIPEWIIHGINGLIINSTRGEDFANSISKLVKNKELYHQISCKNKSIAWERYRPATVKAQLTNFLTLN